MIKEKIKKINSDTEKITKIIEFYILSSGKNPENFNLTFTSKLKSYINKDDILNFFIRYIENAYSKQTLFNTLESNDNLLDLLFIIFENSKFLSEILINEPNLFYWVLDKNIIESKKNSVDFENEIKNTIEVFTTVEKKIDAIKRYFRRNILRVGVRDLFLNISLVDITGELSSLADSIIKIVTELTISDLKFKYGKVPNNDFAIFGLGKLGGFELNYSSDIDLIMVYRDDGEFKSKDKKIISFFNYYQELGKTIIKYLSETTSEGYLYRVDMRLRPEGNSGPLVSSYSFFLTYYESRGEIWERQMLIKARVIYQSNNFGEEILDNITSFVYPKYFTINPLEEIAKIKFRIEVEKSKDFNIKLCKGGIRDIEFSIQALQLLNGGKNKNIREKNTLKAIEALEKSDFLSRKEAKLLSEAYIFYRTIEHRLQIKSYHQTFMIPDDKIELLRLSRSLKIKSINQFKNKLKKYLSGIREIFDKIFKINIKKTYADVEIIISNNIDLSRKVLNKYGINELKAIDYLKLIVYGSTSYNEKLLPQSISNLSKEVLSLVFNNLKNYPNPFQIIKNLEYIISRRTEIEYFLRTLLNEKYLKYIMVICAYSNAFTKILAENDRIIELLYSLGLNDIPQDMIINIKEEDLKEIIFLQIIIMNLTKKISYDSFFNKLSKVFNDILCSIVIKINKEKNDNQKFVIFALGKLGSNEMGINSDVDLLFIYDSSSESEQIKYISFFEELMKRISNEKSTLFEIDLRLRPEGKNAPIAIDYKTFCNYLRTRASIWEKMALTKIRPVIGNKNLIKSVIREIEAFVYDKISTDAISAIMDMRRSIERKAIKLNIDTLDIKNMEGGMVDIEFISQIIKIIFGSTNKSIRNKNTVKILRYIMNNNIFSKNKIKYLIETYYFYRNIEKHIALNNLSERYIFRRNDEKNIGTNLGYKNNEELFLETKKRMVKTRNIYNSFFKKILRLV